MEKILICAVPYVDTVEPIMAPAILKSVLKTHNIDSIALDLNIEIVNILENHPNRKNLIDFFFAQEIDINSVDDITEIINYCSDRILSYNPNVLCLSLLIYTCQIFTRWLCASIKHKSPNIKIVIGGTGIRNFIGEENLDFCIQLKKQRLIDDYIVGDGEISFYEFIKGNKTYPGINSSNWAPVPDLNLAPWPDYCDYQFNQYKSQLIPICDSRGCIKNCEFCDVIEYWSKFQYRTAENIFSEMLYQIERHNILRFSFRSSLVNGNLKEFRKLMNVISDYNQNRPTYQQISWEGYFIIRNEKQHTEELWGKIRQSNGTLLVGVESVISKVRHNLGKTFEDNDIDYNLMLGQKFNVPLVLLMIVAYPTETLADFEYTKQWFRNRKQYANNSISAIHLSFASILPGTQLNRKSNDYGIKKGKLPSIWINQNLKITSEVRKQYLLDLYDICKNECGFKTLTNEETIKHTNDDNLY